MSRPDYPEMPSPVYIRKAHEELLVAEKSATASKWIRRGLGFAAASAIFAFGNASDRETELELFDVEPTDFAAGAALLAGISAGDKKKREATRYSVVAARIAPIDVEEAVHKVNQ